MSELLARTLGETISVETVLAAGLWQVRADPGQLESAILNLSVNARDAMPQGGRLTIETSNAYIDETYAKESSLATGQFVLIAVTDTGSGMSPEVIAKAFDPFFTTKRVGKGTGLGLSQVYGFVRQSGGNVRIYSELEVGTTVKIYLPRLDASLTAPAAPPLARDEAPLVRARPGETILLVEDNDGVRRYGVGALEGLGYRVLAASDGAAALGLLDGDAERIDLLFTDVVLPGGISGAAVADKARARHPHLPVLFTTGYAAGAVLNGTGAEAKIELLGKPYTLDGLARKVRQVIDAGGRRA